MECRVATAISRYSEDSRFPANDMPFVLQGVLSKEKRLDGRPRQSCPCFFQRRVRRNRQHHRLCSKARRPRHKHLCRCSADDLIRSLNDDLPLLLLMKTRTVISLPAKPTVSCGLSLYTADRCAVRGIMNQPNVGRRKEGFFYYGP